MASSPSARRKSSLDTVVSVGRLAYFGFGGRLRPGITIVWTTRSTGHLPLDGASPCRCGGNRRRRSLASGPGLGDGSELRDLGSSHFLRRS